MKIPFRIKNLAFALIALLSISLFSCGSENKGAYHSLNGARQQAIGEIDEIVVISSNRLWKTALKDSFEFYFASPFLLLPQPEPVFKVKHFTYHEIHEKPLRKKFRTILVMADMGDTDSPETKMVLKDLGKERVNDLLTKPDAGFATAKNKWVDNQLIIYLIGDSQEDLERKIVDKFPGIAAKVRQHDRPKINKRVFYNGSNKGAMKLVKDTFGIDIRIPPDFIVSGVKSKDLVWIRKETNKTSSSLIIAKFPYKNAQQLSADTLRQYVNAIGQQYIASREEGSYFVINDHDLPLIRNTANFDGHFVTEIRGIWELENDYMGGPFIAYLAPNPNKKDELILLLGFVYAPQKKKKPYIEDMEEIIRTVKLDDVDRMTK